MKYDSGQGCTESIRALEKCKSILIGVTKKIAVLPINEWLSVANGASVSVGRPARNGGHHDALCNSRRQRHRACRTPGDNFGWRAGGPVDPGHRGERTIESRADRDLECAARCDQAREVQGPQSGGPAALGSLRRAAG